MSLAETHPTRVWRLYHLALAMPCLNLTVRQLCCSLIQLVSPEAEVATQLKAAGSVDVTAEELAASVASNRHDQQRAQRGQSGSSAWSKPPLRASAVAARTTCSEKAAEDAWQV